MTKKKTKSSGKPEVITWLDHCGWDTTRWHELGDTKQLRPLEVITVG